MPGHVAANVVAHPVGVPGAPRSAAAASRPASRPRPPRPASTRSSRQRRQQPRTYARARRRGSTRPKPARHQREQVIQPGNPRSKVIISQHETGILPAIVTKCCWSTKSGRRRLRARGPGLRPPISGQVVRRPGVGVLDARGAYQDRRPAPARRAPRALEDVEELVTDPRTPWTPHRAHRGVRLRLIVGTATVS